MTSGSAKMSEPGVATRSDRTLLTVSLDPRTHERLRLAAALEDESASFYLRRAVRAVIGERLDRRSNEQWRADIESARSAGHLHSNSAGMSERVAVRISRTEKERLDLIAKALHRSQASLVREGLEQVLAGSLGDKDLDQLRAELVDWYIRRADVLRATASCSS